MALCIPGTSRPPPPPPTYGITSVAIALRDLHRRADNVERLCYFRLPFFSSLSSFQLKWNKGGDWRIFWAGREEKISINMRRTADSDLNVINRFDYEEKNNTIVARFFFFFLNFIISIDLFYIVSFRYIFVEIPTIIDHLNFPQIATKQYLVQKLAEQRYVTPITSTTNSVSTPFDHQSYHEQFDLDQLIIETPLSMCNEPMPHLRHGSYPPNPLKWRNIPSMYPIHLTINPWTRNIFKQQRILRDF